MPEILKPLELILDSSREIVSLKLKKNYPDLQFITMDQIQMSLVSPPLPPPPQFKWQGQYL
jgi:hypothetical protein